MSVALTLTEQTFILCPIDNITPILYMYKFNINPLPVSERNLATFLKASFVQILHAK